MECCLLFPFIVLALAVIYLAMFQRRGESHMDNREAIRIVLDNLKADITKKHKHLYKIDRKDKNEYCILHFNNNGNMLSIPEDKFDNVEEAIDAWLRLVGE